jgi:hypothetical protein
MGLLSHSIFKHSSPPQRRALSVPPTISADNSATACRRRNSLRVCPETLDWIAKFSEHEANGSEAQERKRFAIEVLPILGEPSATIEPSDGALDDPAFGDDLEADCGVGSLDDFNVKMRENFCQRLLELRSLVTTVGEELFQKGKHPKQGRHDENAAIAILNIGRMDDGVEQEA